MELKIGENIRRLRKNMGITQERLSELMNVSCAAVSKWESSDSYPDIALIMPLASAFGVTVDELMGYNPAKIGEEIDKILEQYGRLGRDGRYSEGTELITRARKDYPGDYRVMNRYMWDIAGGCADNDPAVLRGHHEEFMQICDCLLDGCGDERTRLEAMTMKAKLLHASGETGAALGILSQFPSWYQSAEQKSEQLFAKDTPEFRRRVRRNLYELADFTANKLIKTVWYSEEYGGRGSDEKLSGERTARCERLGDLLTEMRKESGENVFAVFEEAAFAELSSKLTYYVKNDADIIRIRGKALEAASILTGLAKNDEVLRGYLIETYNTDDPRAFCVEWLTNTAGESYARLRENPEYMRLLRKYSKQPD